MASDDNFDLDSINFDDIDFGGLDDTLPEVVPQDRKPVARLTTSFISGVKDTATDPSAIEQFIYRALPAEYERAADKGGEIINTARSLYNTATKELAPSIKVAKDTLRNAMPERPSFVPEKLYEKLKHLLAEKEGERDYFYDAKEEEIASTIGDIFSAHMNEQEERRIGVDFARDKVEGERHDVEVAQLQATRVGIERLVGYQDGITAKYQAKSLELQYRQLYVSQDSLEVLKASSRDQSSRLDAIVKNTGLPETQKIQLNEAFGQGTRDRLVGSAVDRFAAISGGLRERIVGNLRSKIKESATNVNLAAQGFGSAARAGSSVGGLSTAGGIVGSLFGEEASIELANRLSGVLDRNARIRRGAATAGYYMDNAEELINEWGEYRSRPDEKYSKVKNFIKSFIPNTQLGVDFDENLVENGNKPTHFSVMMGKSITEIIPDYLSRILQATERIAGNANADRLVFDPYTNGLIGAAQRREDSDQRLFNQDVVEDVNYAADNILSLMALDNLSTEGYAALKRQFLSDAFHGKTFTQRRYSNPDSYDKITDSEVVGEVVAYIDGLQQLLQDGTPDQKAAAQQKVTRLAFEFKRLRNSAGNPRQLMATLGGAGRLGDLKDMGLVKRVDDKDVVDYDAYLDRLISKTDDYRPGESGIGAPNNFGPNGGNGFVPGESRPRLTAAGFSQGEYRDGYSGKVLNSLDDVSGEVVDRYGNVILSGSEYDAGLVDETGKPIASGGGIFSSLRNRFAASNIGQAAAAQFQRGAELVSGRDQGEEDVYVEGEAEPRMVYRKLINGEYFDAASGAVLRSFDEIKGPVVDRFGHVVLEAEDLRRGLVSRVGEKLRWAAGLYGRYLKWAFGLPLRAVRGVRDGLGGLFGGGMTTGMIGGVSSLQPAMASGAASVEHSATEAVQSFMNILDDYKQGGKRDARDSDGDGYRDGSWQQAFADKKEKEAKGDGEKKSEVAAESGLFGLLGGGIKSLFDRFNPFGGKGGDEGGLGIDDVADAADLLGRDGDDGDRKRKKKGPKRKGPKRKGPKVKAKGGRFGKLIRGTGKVAKGLGKGALTAGRFALGTGGTLLRGGAMLTSAVGGALSAPVVLTGLAVAAVGAGTYFAYKHFAGKKDPLYRFRMMQYGISPDADVVAKIIELEKILDSSITYKENVPDFDELSAPVEKMIDLFELKVDDHEGLKDWTRWFSLRFKPVYLKWKATHRNISPKTDFHKLDEDLTAAKKLSIVRLVALSGEDTYPYTVKVPDIFDAGDVTQKDILELEAELRKKFDEEAKEEREKAKKASEGGGGGFIAGVKSIFGFGSSKNDEGKASASTVPKPATAHTGVNATVSAGTRAAATFTATGSVIAMQSATVKRVDAIQSVRMRTYGLTKLEEEKVSVLKRLEEKVYDNVTFNSDNVGSFSGDLEDYLKRYGASFGVNQGDEDQRLDWDIWFQNRFVPTLLAYVTAVRAEDQTLHPFTGAMGTLSPAQRLRIAMATSSAMNDNEESVWGVNTSPFPYYMLNIMPSSVEGNLAAIRADLKDPALAEEKLGPGDSRSNSTTNFNTPVDFNESPSPSMNTFHTYAGVRSQSTFGGRNYQGGAGTSFGGSMETGAPIAHPGKGTGGDVNMLPMSNGDGSFAAHKDLILAASKMAGVDPKLMATMASIESGFRASVKASTSSATGLYQFINSTWQTMLKKYGAKYGIAPNAPRQDPRANALMGAEFLKENMRYLQGKLDRPITDTDLYLAHFMGAGGAYNLLKGKPNDNAAMLNPAAAKANKNIFYTNGRPNTLSEVYGVLNQKVRSHGNKFSDLSLAQAPPLDPSKVPAESTAGPDTVTPTVEGGESVASADTGSSTDAPSFAASGAPPLLSRVSTPPSPGGESTPATTFGQSNGQTQRQQAMTRAAMETETQSQHIDSMASANFETIVNVLRDSNNTLKNMDRTLVDIHSVMSGGRSAPAPAPVAEPSSRKPMEVKSVNTPISLRRHG